MSPGNFETTFIKAGKSQRRVEDRRINRKETRWGFVPLRML